MGCWQTNGSPNLVQKTRPYNKQLKRELVKLWIWLSRHSTEKNWKKVKRRISTWTLIWYWKNSGTWTRQLYQSWLVLWYSHQRIIKGTVGLVHKRTSGDHPNYYIIENGLNTEKNPGNPKRLVVTQTPVKYHLLTLIWKRLKE